MRVIEGVIRSCPGWDNPHGTTVNRKAPETALAVNQMLFCCKLADFSALIANKSLTKNKKVFQCMRAIASRLKAESSALKGSFSPLSALS